MVDRSVTASGETDERVTADAPAARGAVEHGGRGSLAWARAARILWLIAVAIAILLLFLATQGEEGTSLGFDIFYVEFVAVSVLFPTVGVIVATRRPESYAGWLMLAFGVAFGIILLLAAYESAGLPPATRNLPGAVAAAWIVNIAFIPVLAGFAATFLLYFPDGRLLSPRWRLENAFLTLMIAAYAFGQAFRSTEVDEGSGVMNPLAWSAPLGAIPEALAAIANIGLLVAVLIAVGSIVQRYRTAERLQRYQIRWIALLGVVMGICFSIAIFQVAPVSDIAWAGGFLCIALLPVAVGIAITRYRLYDIDEIINRAIVYGALTAILAGIFTASITLSQRVFSGVTGERSDAAIVITTLIVASAYTPVRKWLEAIVDRRFKFESPRFGAYRAQLRETLDLIDPDQARDRLVREVVRELGATGGAIVTERDGVRVPSHVTGDWSSSAVVLKLAIPNDPLDEHLELTTRPDGRGYADREVASLEDVLILVSRTMGVIERRAAARPVAR